MLLQQLHSVPVAFNSSVVTCDSLPLCRYDAKYEEGVVKFCDDNMKEDEKGKWRCLLPPNKLFESPEFVGKHIRNKQQDKLAEVAKKVSKAMAAERFTADPGTRRSSPVPIASHVSVFRRLIVRVCTRAAKDMTEPQGQPGQGRDRDRGGRGGRGGYGQMMPPPGHGGGGGYHGGGGQWGGPAGPPAPVVVYDGNSQISGGGGGQRGWGGCVRLSLLSDNRNLRSASLTLPVLVACSHGGGGPRGSFDRGGGGGGGGGGGDRHGPSPRGRGPRSYVDIDAPEEEMAEVVDFNEISY